MRTFALALVALCATIASAEDSILGLAFRPATTTVASGLEAVMLNPSSGASGTVADFRMLPGGSVGISSVAFDANANDVYTFQLNKMGNRGYLTANRFGAGPRTQCRLTVAPIAFHFDGRDSFGNPQVVGVVHSAPNKQLQIVRITRMANAIDCKISTIDTTALIATMVTPTTAYQNGRLVLFTTTDQSTTVSGTLVTVDVTNGSNRFPLTNKKLSFAVHSMDFTNTTTSKDLVIFGTTTANKRGIWMVDLENNAATGISTLVEANTVTANAHGLYTFAVLRAKKQFRYMSGTNAGALSLDGFNLGTSVTTTSTSTSVTLARKNFISTVAVPMPVIARMSGSPTSSNTLFVRGKGVFGGMTASNVAKCQFVYSGTTVTSDLLQVAGQDQASCSFAASPAAGTVVTFSVSADGNTYSAPVSFTYACTPSALTFAQKDFRAVSGLASSKAQEPLEVQIRDSANRQCLFGVAGVTVDLGLSATDGSAGSLVGTTKAAATVSGLVTFPSFAIKVTKASSSNSQTGTFSLSASSTSASSASITATVRYFSTTASTLIGTGLSSTGKFTRYLLNPAESSNAIKLSEMNVASTSALALGLSAVDGNTNVIYTIERRENSGTPRIHLVGNAVSSGSASAVSGECVIPDSVTQNTVVGIWFFGSTATDVTFLTALQKAGNGIRLAKITRTFTQSATSDCTLAEVDTLPVEEIPIGAARYYDGFFAWYNNNNEYAGAESMAYSTASVANGALFSVVRLPQGTAGTATFVPMLEVVRQKELPFAVTNVVPMGTGQFLVSGFTPSTSAATTFQAYHIDATTSEGKVTVLADTDKSKLPVSPFAYALAFNSDPTDFSLNAVHGDETTQSLSRQTGQILTTIASAENTYTGANRLNLVDLNVISEPTITGLAKDTTSATAITVTASNVIVSSLFRCRYAGSTTVTPTVAATNQVTFPSTVTCDAVPASLMSGSSITVEISSDGIHFSNAGTLILNPTPVPSSATISNPTGVNGVATNLQRAFYAPGRAVSECAKFITDIENVCTAAKTPCKASNCAASNGITGATILQTSGIAAIGVFNSAADATTFDGKASGANADPAVVAALKAAGITTVGTVRAATTASTDDDDLSDGEIAGIVIGSIAGVVLIAALVVFAIKASSSNSSYAGQSATYASRDITASGTYDATTGSYDYTSGSYDSEDSGSYDSEDYSDDYDESYV